MFQIFVEKEGSGQLCDCLTMEIPGGENAFGRKRSSGAQFQKSTCSFKLPCWASFWLSSQSQLRENRRVEVEDMSLCGCLDLSLLSESMEDNLVGAGSPNVKAVKSEYCHSTLLSSLAYFDPFQTITVNTCFYRMPHLFKFAWSIPYLALASSLLFFSPSSSFL